MKTKIVIKKAPKLAEPFRVTNGDNGAGLGASRRATTLQSLSERDARWRGNISS
jgi:hypothetical protein